MSAKKILLAVAEELVRTTLAEQLELHDEFAVVPVISGEAAIQKTKKNNFELILLDINREYFEGLQVCRGLRKSHVKCPIIVLISAENEVKYKSGMEFGPNDYLIKPFKFANLLSCVRTHIHKNERSKNSEFTVGPYIFWPATRHLIEIESKNFVRLTDKRYLNEIFLGLFKKIQFKFLCSL